MQKVSLYFLEKLEMVTIQGSILIFSPPFS